MGREVEDLVDRLARARIGETHNQYADSALRRERLRAYLDSRVAAALLLVGEAAGYRGARVSGIPFTSERQLSGRGPGEATATIVHRVLVELHLSEHVLLWNLVPTHPGTDTSNRVPTRSEIAAAQPFVCELAQGRLVVAVGRVAHRELGGPYIRHPSHGGGSAFRDGLGAVVAAARDSPIGLGCPPMRRRGRTRASRTVWRPGIRRTGEESR